MKRAAHPLLKPYCGKPVVLDTNVLLLYWCASFDTGLVHTFKRLNSFSEDDIELLHQTLRSFETINTTPHVLTEVSNLANSLPAWRKEGWSSHFARQVGVVKENWISARMIVETPAIFLGLTDAALCGLASTHVILTIDFPLSNYLESRRLNVVNFNHLRESRFVND
jgi:hypothetical protein